MSETSGLEYYEKVYYGGQVEGRGLTTPESLERDFRRRAAHYDETFLPLLPADRTTPCLDLACGYGNWLFYLRERGFTNGRGVDFDPGQVALARSIGLDASEGDVRLALSEARELGMVSAFDLIEHLDKNDAVRLLESAVIALRDDGMLIIQCPCADGFSGAHDLCNDLTHRWAPSSNMLRQLLMTVGFKRVQLIDMTLPPYPQGVKRKLMMSTRKVLRKLTVLWLRLIGVHPPRVWSNSVIAVAWKR